ncbi:MAG: transcription termination/antitermination protein NusA [Spirochaetaceae bacterium]|nr:MAG: transcription termination/antitermination protein NusA [Spirochaetaceae bacterium]
MASALNDAIRNLANDKGISEELIHHTIEEFLLAAYKKRFGTSDNAVVKFDDEGEVTLFAQKKIVEDVYDPVTEIDLEEAVVLNDECEIGDELLIEINPMEFDRGAIQSAKQRAKQTLREIQKDTLYSEFKDKVGEMIIGYYQRERNGNIFVDLGKTEGILPKRYQSPREIYRPNDRIKALIYEVNKTPSGLQIVLSRTHTEFVRRVFELEVPEIYDKTVEIYKIVREPGYRTKIAVYSNRDDVDPVGACVGMRGVRIQSIVRELEGEKIDILKYDNDPVEFIKNALSPAEVTQVVVLDEAKRQALAIVGDNQLSLAIGKQGLNVRLANRLADWSIDVKTDVQFDEMDITAEHKRAVSRLFREEADETQEEDPEISVLPGITETMIAALKDIEIERISDLVELDFDELDSIEGLEEPERAELRRIITESVEFIEPEDEDEAEYQEEVAGADETEVSGESDEAPVITDDSRVDETAEEDVTEDDTQEISKVSELPDITEDIANALVAYGVEEIVDLLGLPNAELEQIPGLSAEGAGFLRQIIAENVEIVEQEDEDE